MDGPQSHWAIWPCKMSPSVDDQRAEGHSWMELSQAAAAAVAQLSTRCRGVEPQLDEAIEEWHRSRPRGEVLTPELERQRIAAQHRALGEMVLDFERIIDEALEGDRSRSALAVRRFVELARNVHELREAWLTSDRRGFDHHEREYMESPAYAELRELRVELGVDCFVPGH